MKKLVKILVLLGLQTGFAQMIPSFVMSDSKKVKSEMADSTALSDEELNSAIKMYLQMTETPAYLAQREAHQKFRDKKPPAEIPEDLEKFREWMTWNLSSTKFENADEAVQMYKRYQELFLIQFEENKILYELISRASTKQILLIFQPELARARSMFNN